jgi:hypothetical protein
LMCCDSKASLVSWIKEDILHFVECHSKSSSTSCFHLVCTSCTKPLYFACNLASKEFTDYNVVSTMKCNFGSRFIFPTRYCQWIRVKSVPLHWVNIPPSLKEIRRGALHPTIHKEWGGKSYLTFIGIRSLALLRTRCKTPSYAS